MKYYLFIFFISLQISYATSKDTLRNSKIVEKFHQFTAELDDDCDACGCSASGGSMGFASMLNTNFIGIRYFYQAYKSNDGLYSNSPWYAEQFNTTQIWARIPLFKKIQLTAVLPYHFHNRETATGKQNISGIGDATIIGLYQIYQTKKDSTYFAHTLQMGLGVKLPLGKFNDANNGSINPSYQVGTGSWDYHFVAEYGIRRKKLGLNTQLNYVVKTANSKNYQFGNQFNYSGTVFYLFEKKGHTIAPQLGFAGEEYAENKQHNQLLKNTSGTIIMTKIGLEIGKKNLSFGASAMLPISQNLTNGTVEANYRWSVNVNYAL